MNNYWKALSVLLVCFISAGCQSKVVNAPSRTVEQSQHACADNGMTLNPQGLHRIGSVGGVSLNHPAVITVDPAKVAAPSYLVDRLAATGNFAKSTNDVVIVVADDFGKARNKTRQSVYTIDPSLFSLGLDALGSVGEDTSEDLRAALKDELDNLLMRAKLSHGALTFNMLIDILSHVPGARNMNLTPAKFTVNLGEATIVVQAAEVSGLDTTQIKNVLAQIVTDYTREGVSQFVFNFSFTLEPCTEFESPRAKTTQTALLSKAILNDPLYRFIHGKTYSSKTTKVFLASAGNNGQTFAAQPANWPAVVGVSASKVRPLKKFATDTRATFSNYGEIMAPGSWLKLTDPLERNGVGHEAAEVILEGTSFSVLLATVFSALDLTQAKPTCGLNNKTGIPKLAQSKDMNRTLESAVANCQKYTINL